jgi:hypothetical protein
MVQHNGSQGRDSCGDDFSRHEKRLKSLLQNMSAEGASLEQANPDETLRQKDPVPNHSGKFVLHAVRFAKQIVLEQQHRRCKSHDRDNLSGSTTEARDPFRAPLAFNRQHQIQEETHA